DVLRPTPARRQHGRPVGRPQLRRRHHHRMGRHRQDRGRGPSHHRRPEGATWNPTRITSARSPSPLPTPTGSPPLSANSSNYGSAPPATSPRRSGPSTAGRARSTTALKPSPNSTPAATESTRSPAWPTNATPTKSPASSPSPSSLAATLTSVGLRTNPQPYSHS